MVEIWFTIMSVSSPKHSVAGAYCAARKSHFAALKRGKESLKMENGRNGNYRPRLLRTVVLEALAFRGASKEFPAARVARIQQSEGECVVRPTYCFRPKDAQAEAAEYPVKIRVYRISGKEELHGVAEPLPEAQLTRVELLEIQQLKREVVFKKGDRGLVARDPAVGMFITPASNWAEVMGGDPEAGTSYQVLLEEYPNKFVAHPRVPGMHDIGVTTSELAIADRSGAATMFHAIHVMSADGNRWVNFRDVLWIAGEEFTKRDVELAFRKLSKDAHPDKKMTLTGSLAAARQKLATAKMTCLEAARDKAFDWLKGCPAILVTGERKGERCGAKRMKGSLHCSRHQVHADPNDAMGEALLGLCGPQPR